MATYKKPDEGLGETRLYRVTMVVAVHPVYCPDGHPNIEESPEGVVLWATTDGFNDVEGVQIVGEPAVQELRVTLASREAVKAEVAESNVPDDEDSIADALAAPMSAVELPATPAKAKRKRKKHKKQYRPSPRVAERMQKVLTALQTMQQWLTADEIAALSSVPVKQVYADLYHLHDLKQVSAIKNAGKVRWLANDHSDNNNNESK